MTNRTLLSALMLMAACNSETPKPTTDSDPTGEVTDGVCDPELELDTGGWTTDASGDCILLYNHSGGSECNQPVQGVYLIADTTSSPGSNVTVTGPTDCDQTAGTTPDWDFGPPEALDVDDQQQLETDGDWLYAVAQYETCLPLTWDDVLDGPAPTGETANVGQGGIDCDNEWMDDDAWVVSVGPPASGSTCDSTYGDPEDYSLTFIWGGSHCETAVERVSAAGCTPATGAPVTFVYETVYDYDGGTTQHATLTPIQQSGAARFSERGWLRKITVNSWGDTNNLHVRNFGERFLVSDSDVIDDTTSTEITPSSGVVTFAAGEVLTNTIWSVDDLPSNDPTFTLPTITVDWSCQVDSGSPHYTVVSSPQAYEIQLSELNITGLSAIQRLYLRFPSTDVAFLHLEGRTAQRLDFPLTDLGSGIYGFDRTLSTHGGVHLAGTMTASGSNRVVTFTDLEINGNDFGTPTWTFEPVP